MSTRSDNLDQGHPALEMISLDDHLDCPDDQQYHLVDLTHVVPHVANDFYRRNENVLLGHQLCLECDGTGNKFFFMYKECEHCNGRGFVA